VALKVLEKIFKDLASLCFFTLCGKKIFRISEPCELILKRPTQGTFLQKGCFLGILVYEKIKELLTRTCKAYELPDVRSE
jgi:hypothetical protein